jgi:phosphoribosyl 1,2-cyclic phosphate phosphodiesterase
MRFLFLGTGTSAGIPAIACDCAVCTSADPRDRRLRTSAAIQFPDPSLAAAPGAGLGESGAFVAAPAGATASSPAHSLTPSPAQSPAPAPPWRTVLIDASPDLRQQALRHNLRRCDAILFTHNHVDHVFGLDEVRRFNVVQRSAIDVYADEHTLASLQRIYQHIFEQQRNVNKSFVATLIANRAAPGEAVDLHGLRFTPFRVMHGRLPILAYRVESAPGSAVRSPLLPLAYCTDVSSIPTDSWRYLEGVNTLVLDALRHRHHPTHLTVEQAVNIAERVGAGQSWFVHMTHDLSHAETDAGLPEGMHLAYDGLVLE